MARFHAKAGNERFASLTLVGIDLCHAPAILVMHGNEFKEANEKFSVPRDSISPPCDKSSLGKQNAKA